MKIPNLTDLEIKALNAIHDYGENQGWYHDLFSKSARDKAVFGSLVKKGLAITTPEDLSRCDVRRRPFDWVELTQQGVIAARLPAYFAAQKGVNLILDEGQPVGILLA